jgi:hypothetical protein
MKALLLSAQDGYEAIYLGEKLLIQGISLALDFYTLLQDNLIINELEIRNLSSENEKYLEQYGIFPDYLIELTLDK